MTDQIQNFHKASEDFLEVVKKVKLDEDVYKDGWNAKEIISHVIFYQKYYSSIVESIVNEQELPLIDKSLSQTNIKSAEEFQNSSRDELLIEFEKAKNLFLKCIKQIAANKQIPYKKGGRIYTAKAYTEEITRHLIKHTKDLARKLSI